MVDPEQLGLGLVGEGVCLLLGFGVVGADAALLAEGEDLAALDACLAHEEVQQEPVILAHLAVLLQDIAPPNTIHLHILVPHQELRGIQSPATTPYHSPCLYLPK